MFRTIRSKIKELGRLTPLAIISMLMPMIGSATLIAFVVPIGRWLRENSSIGMPVFVVVIAIVCGFALLPTNVVGIVGGWAFGFVTGSMLLMAGVVGASIISYAINSRISGDRLPEMLEKYPRASAVHEALLQSKTRTTIAIVTLIRASVIFPFGFTNLFLAAAKVRIAPYVVGTSVGMLPRSSAMAFIGSGLAELDLSNTSSTYFFVLSLLMTIISLIVITIVSRRALSKMAAEPRAV